MKEKFWCASCKKIFEAKGEKKEWNDPIYGPCMNLLQHVHLVKLNAANTATLMQLQKRKACRLCHVAAATVAIANMLID